MTQFRRLFIPATLCLSLLGTPYIAFSAYQINTTPSDESLNSSQSICSLREAVTMVNSQSFGSSTNCHAEFIEGDIDSIILDAGAYKLNNTLNVRQSLQLRGQSTNLTTIGGGNSSTVLTIDDQDASQGSVTLENLSIIDGGKKTRPSRSDVGAISSTENLLLNHVYISTSFGKKASAILIDGASLTILNSEFSYNTGSAGVISATSSSAVSITNTRIIHNEFATSALLLNNVTYFEISQSEISMNSGKGEAVSGSIGIINTSTGRLINSTIAANKAKQEGSSGIYVNNSNLEIHNSTISFNADESGSAYTYISGLLAKNGANVALINSVLAGNSDNFGHPSDCRADTSSLITSNSYNVVGDTSGCSGLESNGDVPVSNLSELAVLALSNHGGSSHVLMPLSGSPLLDAAKNDDCPDIDQRGFSRPANGQCDVGATEMQGTPYAADIEPLLKKVRAVERVDILSHVSRKESDIDPATLTVEASFNHDESNPQRAEGTFKLTQNNILVFSRGEAFKGEVSLTYSVSDIYGRKSNKANILLKNSDPSAPQAVDDAYQTQGKEYIQFNVLDNDIRGSSNYERSSMVIESDVKYGRLSFLVLNGAGGVFVYTPDSNSRGVDSFTYSIATKEGLRSNIATVTIELPPINAVEDDELGGLSLFMILGLFGLVLSRRLNKITA